MPRPSARLIAFVCILLGCVGSAVTYVSLAVARSHRSAPPPGIHVTGGASLAPSPVAVESPARAVRMMAATSMDAVRGPKILFINMIPDKTVGKLAVAPLANPNSTRAIADLRCERVYYAGARGVCLTRGGVLNSRYVAKVFNANFKVLRQVSLPGIPSRARVSPDGRYAATTMFVRGDNYSSGNFSTRTAIIDLASGKPVADLEKLRVTRNGKRFFNRNFNFWGVTFARDDDHFYASLGSGDNTYLLKGSMRMHSLRVIHGHVECPSLSPDGTKIAFKRSIGTRGNWRLYVLDLRTMKETALAGDDPIDDQAEWLDNKHVLYGNDNTIWQVSADGSGRPTKLLMYAYSPAVVRSG
jgi:WD40-like Beta Propeller Repeat